MCVNAFFYKCGRFLCEVLPRRAVYVIAEKVACLQYMCSRRDRRLISRNIEVIFGNTLGPARKRRMVKEVFMNFGRYLVDFLSFSKVNQEFIDRYVKVDGVDNMRQARASNRGTIVLSAHVGNWELGGLIAAAIGYPLHVVALAHNQEEVNNFFNSQRSLARMEVIPLGAAVRRCFKLLKEKKIVAFIGDREFGDNGVPMTLFGKKVLLPPGPAYFALKTDSLIVPTFLVRKDTMSYRLIFEKPIDVVDQEGRQKTVEQVIQEYSAVMEKCIRDYATQWYMFSDYFHE